MGRQANRCAILRCAGLNATLCKERLLAALLSGLLSSAAAAHSPSSKRISWGRPCNQAGIQPSC
jgi:hypothetical protein